MSSELAAAGPRWPRVPKQRKSTPLSRAKEGDTWAATLGKERQRRSVRTWARGREENRARCLLRMGPVSPSLSRCFSPSSQPSCHTLHAKYCQYCLERAPTAPKCFFTASYLTVPHGVPSGPGPCSSAQGGRGGGVVPGLPEPPRSSSSTRTQPPSPRRAGSRGWPMAAMRAGRSGPEGCAGPAGRAELTSWGGAGSGPGRTEPNPGGGSGPAPGPAGPGWEGKELERRPERQIPDTASRVPGEGK